MAETTDRACTAPPGGSPAFDHAVSRFNHWIADAALPLWTTAGFDQTQGCFREHLGHDGALCTEPHRRTLVQARQIHVCAAAHLAGLDGGTLDLDWRAHEYLTSRAWLDAGGLAHRLDSAGNVADDTRDLYAHAFILFAMAWLTHASGSREPLDLAGRVLDFLDRELADEAHGGFRESLPDALPRRSNPHMHLLEAFLALHEATGEQDFLDRAGAMVTLMREHFIERETGSLGEYFTADWNAAPGDDGALREPGHHYEWAGLVADYSRRTDQDCTGDIDTLVGFAARHGSDTATGLVLERVDKAGRPLGRNHRIWAQTEAARTRLMLARAGVPGEFDEVARLIDALFDHHLLPNGAWRDRIDGAGNATGTTSPASSLYHLMTLYWDLHGAAAR